MLAEKTGWTYHYIMYRVTWINVRMMLADAPQYTSGLQDERIEEATDDDLRDLANSL